MAHLSGPPTAAPFPTSETRPTSEQLGPFGVVMHDPSNPRNGYMLVNCQEAFEVGEVVCIDQDGLATQIGSNSVGQVGMIVATVSGSDTAAWAQVTGELSNAIVTSGVTTGLPLIAPATSDGGYLSFLTTGGGNVVQGGRAITAASTATSPTFGGGLADLFIGMGGAWVNGIASDMGMVS